VRLAVPKPSHELSAFNATDPQTSTRTWQPAVHRHFGRPLLCRISRPRVFILFRLVVAAIGLHTVKNISTPTRAPTATAEMMTIERITAVLPALRPPGLRQPVTAPSSPTSWRSAAAGPVGQPRERGDAPRWGTQKLVRRRGLCWQRPVSVCVTPFYVARLSHIGGGLAICVER
jgi:hypothetical protein